MDVAKEIEVELTEDDETRLAGSPVVNKEAYELYRSLGIRAIKSGYVADDVLDYEAVGLICGLEVHQQLLTERKLFCHCPAGLYTTEHDGTILRHMRPTLSELGEYDERLLDGLDFLLAEMALSENSVERFMREARAAATISAATA